MEVVVTSSFFLQVGCPISRPTKSVKCRFMCRWLRWSKCILHRSLANTLLVDKKKKISHRHRSVAWELIPLFGPLSQRGLNPIKPVYDPDWLDGRLNFLTASAFHQLGQYTSSPGAGATAMQNSLFSSLAVAVTITSTHCAYPRRDGQAELAWVAGYVMRQFTCPKAVTHLSTNRARCRATALIETNALPLHQTANRDAVKTWSKLYGVHTASCTGLWVFGRSW